MRMRGLSSINPRKLKKWYEDHPREVVAELSEAIQSGQAKAEEFSVRDLARSLVPYGDEWVESMQPGKRGYHILEGPGAVMSTDFVNVTGQILFTKILEGYKSEDLVFTKLIPTVHSEFPGVEKIPGITQLGDNAEIVDEGQPYPFVGVGENYIEIGPKVKRGFITPITREAVFADRTGWLLKQASDSGRWMGVNKEKRLIYAFLDEGGAATNIHAGGNRYHWKGTSYATYQTTSPWINVLPSTTLTAATTIDAVEQIAAALLDPFTGEPLALDFDTIVVGRGQLFNAMSIVHGSSLVRTTPGFATTGNPMSSEFPNPYLGKYKIVSSRLFTNIMTTKTNVYFGRPADALTYVENWAIETEEAPPNSEAAFLRDVIHQYKVSEKGVVATVEPRYLFKMSQ